jgi:endonuclease
VRLVIARCSVDYAGRLSARLALATRLIVIKADGSVLIHSDAGTKALNWMPAGSRLAEEPGRWVITGKASETLTIEISEILSDSSLALGTDPGLVKDGVEAHLQELLAAQPGVLGVGWRLVRREYPTPIGPVDLMCKDAVGVSVAVEVTRRGEISGTSSTEGSARGSSAEGSARGSSAEGSARGSSAEGSARGRPRHWAVEVKRRATIDAVEQLTRYLELLNRDPLLAPVGGVLAAQSVAPQARTLAEDRGIRCVILDYDAMRGMPSNEMTLF